MKRATIDTIVGIFVLVGIICLAWLSIRLGKMEVLGGDYYTLTAEFDSISGLKEGAQVEMAGVEVGRVGLISLDQQTARARVVLRINTGVKLRDDVIASVRTQGIIGDKFIKLLPGGSERVLAAGGKIRDTESAVDMEELVSKFIHGKVD